jgi:hypothetical protein
MVYDPARTASKELITAILVADLTPAQLGIIQEKFGNGANLCSPYPSEQLFIHDKRSWSTYTHAALKRAMPDTSPLLVIDAQTPKDGSIWYIERFADDDEVADGLAESTNTLYKIRMKLEAVVIQYQNYQIANLSIDEDMDNADIPTPVPETFEQEEPMDSGFDVTEERYISPTWVTATTDELESSTDPADLENFAPTPDVVYRLKPEVARANGLICAWMFGSEAETVTAPDGKVVKFPEGSKVLQCEYDPETAVPRYERPEGSL